jgi:hypothetical protein
MFTATMSAFDVMEGVHVTATVTLHPDDPSSPVQRVYHTSVTIKGRGEDDPRRWLRDALVGLAEAQ